MLSVPHIFWLLCSALVVSQAKVYDKQFWDEDNKEELASVLKRVSNTNVAKNLILAIGDGMGVSTTTAARILRGQQTPGMLGEEAELTWDRFPVTGLSKTYTTDSMTPDSAGTATAYHTGVKTKSELIGLDDKALRKNCSSAAAGMEGMKSVLQWAAIEGKSVGIVTTDSLFGASPSPAFARSASRNWYDDSDLPAEARGMCKDIAIQLLDNPDIQVLLGGGRISMLGENTTDPEYSNKKGKRKDGRNLMQEWKDMQQNKNRKVNVVYNKTDFDAVSPATTDYLLGVFEPVRMQMEYVRNQTRKEPSLAEMAEKAIRILSKNPKGFYLFLEGANIDVGHHATQAGQALTETLAFDDAIGKVMSLTSSDDTLVVVSADHSHVFSFGGYSERGSSILGLVKSPWESQVDLMNNTFTIISYGNGPGYNAQRTNLTQEMFDGNNSALYMAAVPLSYETHSGDDVPVFASGPMSHLLVGVHEQSFLAHVMKYAACLGDNKEHCRNSATNSGISHTLSMMMSLHASLLALLF